MFNVSRIAVVLLLIGMVVGAVLLAMGAERRAGKYKAEKDSFKAGYEFVAEQYQLSQQILAERENDINQVRGRYEQQARKLQKAKADQCADRAAPDDIISILQQPVALP